jgi:hypothetical protein
VLAIQDKRRCQDKHCRNHPYTCWQLRTAVRVLPRFENHLAVNSNIIVMWSRDIHTQLATLNDLSDNVKLAIFKCKDRAKAQKERRRDNGGAGGGDDRFG